MHTTTIQIEEDDFARLQELCYIRTKEEDRKVSQAEVCRLALQDYLNNCEELNF